MATTTFKSEERVGLVLAVAAHAALVAFLVWRPIGDAIIPPPERMTVTISDEVGLTSTSPEPAAQAAPDVAPDLGEPAPAEPEPEPAPPPPKPQPPQPPKPEPVKAQPKPPPPKPTPRAQPQPPKPVARPAPTPPRPRPTPPRKAAPAPPKAAPTPPRAQPPARPAQPSQARPAQSRPAQSAPPRTPGASRIGDDFLKGAPSSQTTGASRTPPAQTIGPAVRSSLASSISRQLKPKWAAPQGADAELLVTVLSFSLNRDGSLAGRPTVVQQQGINDANRAQAGRHAEQAIRAVQLAAPFDLPEEYYDAWKRIASFRFDKRLSQ